jgi:hypothetical protein
MALAYCDFGLANPDTVTTVTDLILDRASAPTL